MRNIDIVAVGVLLAGIAVYSHLRHAVVFAITSHGAGFTRYSHTIIVPVVPAPPPIPHVRIMRD